MSLKGRIRDDMKAAMRAGDKPRLGVIRMALAAIQQREVDQRVTLDDPQTVTVLDKMIKQRRESVTQFEKGGREDLADKERQEIEVLQAYMPEPLSDSEIDQLIDEAIAATGASTIRDMGKVMAQVRKNVQGRADMGKVSGRVKSRLS